MADNSWLQALINMAPHQPCSVIWRRSCPTAKQKKEGGIDLPSPVGTPVYSLADGVVIGAGYYYFEDDSAAGGVVTVHSIMPDGSINDIYYQHIRINSNITLCCQDGGQLYHNVVGRDATLQKVQKNQLVGWTYPLSGPHVEVGVNAGGPGQWEGIWGRGYPPGPWLDDPEDLIRLLMSNGGGRGTNVNFSTGYTGFDQMANTAYSRAVNATQQLTQFPGIEGPIQKFHDAQKFTPFQMPTTDGNSTSFPAPQLPFLPNFGAAGQIGEALSAPVRATIGVFNFIANNFLPFVIRSFFVIVAMVVLIALLINLTSKTIEEETGGVMPIPV